jgi:hypothetical protein
VEIGNEAAQFPEEEYTNGIFIAVTIRNKRCAFWVERLTVTGDWKILVEGLGWGTEDISWLEVKTLTVITKDSCWYIDIDNYHSTHRKSKDPGLDIPQKNG